MNRVPARVAPALLLVALLAGLGACSDREADQRRAFVGFLQSRVLDKPGLHVPQLTAEERTSFGPYADHYAIITNFHRVMNESVSPKLGDAMARGAIRSVSELTARRSDVVAAKATIDAMAAALGTDQAEADAAHRKLDQPPDVKPVFDAAYDRLVTATVTAFGDVVPISDKVFSEMLDLADYLNAHKDRVKVSGDAVQATDRATQAELGARLQVLQTDQQGIQAAQSRFQQFVYGEAR